MGFTGAAELRGSVGMGSGDNSDEEGHVAVGGH